MEELYNGIKLPDVWPPKDMDDMSMDELPVPYLTNRPDVVNIDVGRQLFVDDFLIEENWLEKRFHQAVLDEAPVLAPETPMEWNKGVAPVAAPFTDGCWYDPADGVYRLYYHAGWFDGTALAVSADGKHFTRKMLDNQVGTNRIFVPKPGWQRDGSCVWLDQETEHPEERYKMFHYFRTPEGDVAQVAVSADGMHFGDPVTTGLCGDNTSFFYNPFRKKWVFSIRTGLPSTPWYSRGRSYYECDRFMEGASWANDQITFWQRCDVRDGEDPAAVVTARVVEHVQLARHDVRRQPGLVPQRPPDRDGEGLPLVQERAGQRPLLRARLTRPADEQHREPRVGVRDGQDGRVDGDRRPRVGDGALARAVAVHGVDISADPV